MKNLIGLVALALLPAIFAEPSGIDDLLSFDADCDLASFNELEQVVETQNSPAAQKAPYVVMVSLDGFRYDYPELHDAQTLLEMKAIGSYVESLIPSFPSKTYPNHYTLATGLYPARHGIVANTFYSRERRESYRLSNRQAVQDGSWYGGTPLWSLATQQGMASASIFWPGSEADIGGYPSFTFEYKGDVPYETRVEKVSEWLALPEAVRPHLIMIYFSATDTIGHRFGPESDQSGRTVRYVDGIIASLRDCIQKSGLPVNLIVTSDHGMTEIEETLNVRDYVDLQESEFVSGPMSMIYTKSAEETRRIYSALQGVSEFETYLEGALPSYLNFSNHDRIGDIVLIAPAPRQLGYWEKVSVLFPTGSDSTHGYDPITTPDMGSIFIAEGPGIESGQKLSPVENVHVYPFVADLLGLEYDIFIDGNPAALSPLLKR